MDTNLSVTVYCGSRFGNNPVFAAFAGSLGEYLAKYEYVLVYGGGSIGLMGVIADAALSADGKVIGIIPDIFVEKEQAHRGISQLIQVPDMLTRKKELLRRGNAFIILPGGMGTLEEFIDTANHFHIYGNPQKSPPIIIANINGIYDVLQDLITRCDREGFLSLSEWNNLHFVSSLKEVDVILSSLRS